MKLVSLKLEPSSPVGWSSEELFFGDDITQLYGPNGCGKTPLIQSVIHALGYPVKFREDILKNCGAIVLKLADADRTIEIRRNITSHLDVEVKINNKTAPFYMEREYSRFLLELFGFDVPTLTSTSGEAVPAYMATLLPIFYVDQDLGYSTVYRPPSVFMRDQYQEMVRLALGLPPKNPFEQKKLVIEKKKRLDLVDRLIVRKREYIESTTRDIKGVRRPLATIDAELTDTRASLENINESKSIRSDTYNAMDSLLHEKRLKHRAISMEIAELNTRVKGFEQIRAEIETEVNTLSLNEEARRLFTSFQDICASQGCGLFMSSSESYAKNLLYLRDQIKDLTRNTERQKVRIETLKSDLGDVEAQIDDLELKRDTLSEIDDVDGLLEAVSHLTRRLADLQKERSTIEELEEDEKAYLEYLNERETLQNELASMTGTANESDLRAIQLRATWRNRVVHWLDVLKTKNVSRQLSMDTDFEFLFGAEKINQLKGSTLVRVVLAIHTAFFEVYLSDRRKKLKLLILDTPRQQDIEREAFINYIQELKKLAKTLGAQIIFSTTNYHYDCTAGDQEWVPTFPGPEQNMFLGQKAPR